MSKTEGDRPAPAKASQHGIGALSLDLFIYLSVMFLIREVSIPGLGFLANGLFWSTSCLLVAWWRMRVRRVTWRDLGLVRPASLARTFLAAGGILLAAIASIIAFEILKDQLPLSLAADVSGGGSVARFGELAGNWSLFLLIMPAVLLESGLEELLERGFLLNWLERILGGSKLATIMAVLVQAAIFGFRHSYDLSERSITVGLIGLVMGTAYVTLGRNLWPLILAHCALNAASMLERVV